MRSDNESSECSRESSEEKRHPTLTPSVSEPPPHQSQGRALSSPPPVGKFSARMCFALPCRDSNDRLLHDSAGFPQDLFLSCGVPIVYLLWCVCRPLTLRYLRISIVCFVRWTCKWVRGLVLLHRHLLIAPCIPFPVTIDYCLIKPTWSQGEFRLL